MENAEKKQGKHIYEARLLLTWHQNQTNEQI